MKRLLMVFLFLMLSLAGPVGASQSNIVGIPGLLWTCLDKGSWEGLPEQNRVVLYTLKGEYLLFDLDEDQFGKCRLFEIEDRPPHYGYHEIKIVPRLMIACLEWKEIMRSIKIQELLSGSEFLKLDKALKNFFNEN